MPEPLQPEEIIAPDEPLEFGLSDAQLDRLAKFLDDGLAIPGTNIRFGIDPIIGLLPGFGDAITSLLSFAFVYAGWRRGLSTVTLLRMVTNIVVDSLCGTLPIFGDLFDFYWKSNRRNYNLLRRHSLKPEASHTWRDWLFLWLIFVVLLAVALLPLMVLGGIIYLLRR
jgi:hypothetical protein